jgi:hypothetical protein
VLPIVLYATIRINDPSIPMILVSYQWLRVRGEGEYSHAACFSALRAMNTYQMQRFIELPTCCNDIPICDSVRFMGMRKHQALFVIGNGSHFTILYLSTTRETSHTYEHRPQEKNDLTEQIILHDCTDGDTTMRTDTTMDSCCRKPIIATRKQQGRNML